MKYKPDLLFITNAAEKRIPSDVVIFNHFPIIGWAGRLFGDKWYGDFITLSELKLTNKILSEVIDILVRQIKETRQKLQK